MKKNLQVRAAAPSISLCLRRCEISATTVPEYNVTFFHMRSSTTLTEALRRNIRVSFLRKREMGMGTQNLTYHWFFRTCASDQSSCMTIPSDGSNTFCASASSFFEKRTPRKHVENTGTAFVSVEKRPSYACVAQSISTA